MSEIVATFGVVAIELDATAPPQRRVLGPAAAGEWAAAIAGDLAKLLPAAAELDLAIVAALYDPAELLRPGWPRHAELDRLLAHAPGAAGHRVLGLGADDGVLPGALSPQAELAGGALAVVPFVLRGEAAALAAVANDLEQQLLDRGMAQAGTALATQAAFGLRIEHMRLLTLHDLTAMTAMQYDHAGLGALWPLLEAALFGDAQAWLDAPPEPLLHLAGGEVRIALLDPEAWQASGFAPDGAADATALARAYEHFQRRSRQIHAVLDAHGVPTLHVHCPAGRDPRDLLRE